MHVVDSLHPVASRFTRRPGTQPRPGLLRSPWHALALTLTLGAASVAHASVIVVDTLNDESTNDGDCSLREAIASANGDVAVDGCTKGLGSDLILVGSSEPATILLTLGALTVTDDLQITLSSNVTIDADDASRILVVDMTSEHHDFTLQGGTLINGATSGTEGGGAMLVRHVNELTVRDVVFAHNRTCGAILPGNFCWNDSPPESSPGGGALAVLRDNTQEQADLVTLDGVVFRGNHSAGPGGAVATTSTVNSGFWIVTTIIDCAFEGNIARSTGGGLLWYAAGDFSMESSSFLLNQAQGSGGFYVQHGGATAAARLTNLLVADNSASGQTSGGTLLFYPDAEIWFSTFTRNTSGTGPGTALFTSGGVLAGHVALVDNPGGDCSSTTLFDSDGYNLDSDGSCGFDHLSDLPSQSSPMTGPIDLGSGRLEVLPLPGSPVVDGGEAVSNCPGSGGGFTLEDLRGEPRSATPGRTASPLCDVGAIERQADERWLFADGFERGDLTLWEE